jgi:CHAT domain-containing protein
MDEQRLQDYLNLVQALLSCRSEEKLEVLQHHRNLVDQGLVWVMEQVAEMMSQKGNQSAADWLRNLAAQLAEPIQNWEQLNQRVVQLYQQGKYRQATMFAEQAMALARKLWGNEHPNLVTSFNNLARLYEAQERFVEAEPLHKEALAMSKRLFPYDHPLVASSLGNLAGFYESQGHLSDAEPLYEEALKMSRRLFLSDDHPLVATSLNNLAELYHLQRRWSDAESLHEEALGMRKRLFPTNPLDVATSLNNLAALYQSQGHLSEAEPLYKEALAIIENLFPTDHPLVASSLNNLAELYRLQRRLLEAEPLYEKALEMRKRLFPQDHSDVATSLNNLALLYQSQGCLSEAEPLCREALAMKKRLFPTEHPYIATSLNNLALLYQSQGRLSNAESLYEEALAMTKRLFPQDHPDVVQSLNNLAALSATTERYPKALELMKEATAIENRLISQAFSASSERDRLAYIQKIRSNFAGFLSLVYKHLRHSPQAVQVALDLVLQRKALTTAALAAQNEALYSGRYPHLQRELEKLQVLSDQIINFTFTQPRPDLLPQLQAKHNHLQKKLASQVPEIQLQEQPVDCRTIALELPEGSTLVEFVCFKVGDFHATNEESKWQPARYLAFILPAGQPDDVQMIDLGEAIYIDRLIHVFRKFASDGIQAVQSLDMGGDDEEDEDLKQLPAEVIQLREAIFDPIRPYLDSRQHLLLAPDGNLNLVPFQILPTDETGKTLLMDEYRISYLSVGRDILRSKIQTKRSASQPLVIADPDFDLTDVGVSHELPLPQPARELLQTWFQRAKGTRFLGEEVAKKLGVSPYLDKEALASRLTNCQSPSILLIATHGYFSEWLQDCVKLIAALLICSDGQEAEILHKNRKLLEPELLEMIEKAAVEFARAGDQNIADRLRNFVVKAAIIDESTQTTLIQPPNTKFQNQKDPMLRSALAFAGANAWLKGKTLPNEAGKGLVFAQEVAALDLWATELAVLSACNTAIGDIKLGEGVFGLRRAFAVAGAKTLVMSLWSVPDRATALLMERFFTNLQQGLGRADALQHAQNYIRTITVKELQQSSLGLAVLEELVEKGLLPRELQSCQDTRPLEHPYFWGAWVCQGDTTAMVTVTGMKLS